MLRGPRAKFKLCPTVFAPCLQHVFDIHLYCTLANVESIPYILVGNIQVLPLCFEQNTRAHTP